MRIFAVCFTILSLNAAYSQHTGVLVISNPNIINIETGRVLQHRDIILRGNWITAIVPHRNNYPAGNTVVNAKGKYVIPGLWDMHMHFGGGDSLLEENKALLPLFIANGITAVRDASADISTAVLQWRTATAEGTLMGPAIFTAGPKLEGINSLWIGDLEVGTVAEMQQAMDSLQRLHVDFIKITDNTIQPAIYLAAIQEARKRGLAISGHIPYALTMQEVSDAGLSSVEHMAYVLKAGAANETTIARQLATGAITSRDVMPQVLQHFDTAYALRVYRQMAANGTAVTPTLSISYVTAYLDQDDHHADAYLKYLGQGLKNTYSWRVKRAAGDNKEAIMLRHTIFEKSAGLLPLLHKAGVTIMAGTDAGYLNSFDYPGQSLHTELALMVKYGLTPLQALQASIINGPRYFKLQSQYGKVAAGYYGDLLILDANPLADITNTQKLNGVITKGRYLSRLALDSMLSAIAEKAAASPFKKVDN